MDNGRLVGMISQKDMVAQVQRGAKEILVEAIMTPAPVSAVPDDTLAHILHLFDRYHLSSLPIVDRRKLVGIITRSDIIRIESAYLHGREDIIGSRTAISRIVYQTRAPETGQGRLLVLLSNPQTAPRLMAMAVAIARDRDYEIEALHVIVVAPHQSLVEVPVRTAVGERMLRQAVSLGLAWQVPVHTQIRVAHNLATAVLQTIKSQHVNLALMGWKGRKAASEWIFSRSIDPVMHQAGCEVVLVKFNEQTKLDRWLVPMAGGPNADLAIKLLPALTTASRKPVVSLCQVFEPASSKPDLTTLDRAAKFLRPYLENAVKTVTLYDKSVSDALIGYAQQDSSDVIILGASRAGMLQKVVNGNIPVAISHNSTGTVILVQGS
jgi:CIC family chloride channel protein